MVAKFKITTPLRRVAVAPLATPYDAQLANAKAYLYTPAQQRTAANQQVGAQLHTALGANYASSKAEQQQFTDLANRAAGLAAALGSFGPQYGEQARTAYDEAAKTIGSLGTGLTGAVASDWQAEQAANRAAVDKTLGPGLGQVSSYDPAAMHSALQYTGVTMPGTTLADQALNERDMGQYGAMADKAQVASISRDYLSQAAQALNQRAAERAAIVAQRPELFQAALTAQRQDAAQTQTRVANLITAAQTWLQNKQKLGQQTKEQAADARIKEIATTHIDPRTGKPVGGWVWTDKTHTAVVPWTSLIGAQQANKRLAQGGRSLDIQEQHYEDMFSAAKRANYLKAQAANQPGGFDKDMSAAVGYISDDLGHPIVTRGGRPVPYKAPGKPGKQMDTETRLKLQGSMAGYAEALKGGHTDPKTGVQDVEAVDIQTAIGKFAARGYFTGKLAPWGMAALSQAYGLSIEQIQQVANNIDPATGGAYGVQPGDYGPPTPSGYEVPQFRPGATWSSKSDPTIGLFGNLAQTKSGRWVDMRTKKYVKVD